MILRLLQKPWLPWVVSSISIFIYGYYLIRTDKFIYVNDFAGHVWMALEERENGIGSSTNLVIPAGYPIILNIAHLFGFSYMMCGRIISLLAAIPILSIAWTATTKISRTAWTGPIAFVLMFMSRNFLLSVATPLPDLIALAMAFALIGNALNRYHSTTSLFISCMFAGLACTLRYNYLQSFLPLSVFLVVIINLTVWKQRLRKVFILISGIFIGLSPEIFFALRAGHVPFQNASKYYLTLITGETNYAMNGTQFKNMPSTIDYILAHFDKIAHAWINGYLKTSLRFIIPLVVIWMLIELLGRHYTQFQTKARMRTILLSLICFEALLLIPISLRQPIPFYVYPMVSLIPIIAGSILLVKIGDQSRILAGSITILLLLFSIWNVDKVLTKLEKTNKQNVKNSLIASVLKKNGISDSSEVIDLTGNFLLYWPFGDKAPLLYYTFKEPGWLSLTNTIQEKRPFLYSLTPEILKQFKAVLTSQQIGLDLEFYYGFRLVDPIEGVQIRFPNDI